MRSRTALATLATLGATLLALVLANPASAAPPSRFWVANNGTNTATVYAGGVNGATPTKNPLEVTIPGGAPTGQVFNNTNGFVIPPSGSSGGGKALFIFASEGGDITAWSPTVLPTAAVTVAHVAGAIYKGLAILHVGNTVLLLAADFHDARIDVFDASFRHLPSMSANFTDPRI